MERIDSETRFVWKFVGRVLITPVTLVMVLFRKKEFKDLFQPFRDLLKFIFGPKFTITIVILNVILYFISIYLFSDAFFESLLNFPSDLVSLRFHTLISSGFLHANLTHLLGNILGIFIFGRVVERRLGSFKTFFVYFGALLISGIFESLIHLVLTGNNIPALGASGALMGLVSTAILLDPFYLTYELLVPLPVMVVGWLTIYADIAGVLNPTQDGIAHFAHIGGFISIGLLMFFLGGEDRSKLKKGLVINLVSLVIGVLLYFLIV